MTRWSASPFLAVLVLAAGAPAAAQAQQSAVPAPSSMTTTLDTTRITVGDRLRLDVRIRHPANAAVSWPDSLELAPFELLDVAIPPARRQGDVAVSSATFSLTAFELGELELPSFQVTVLHPQGREEVLETDRYGVEVMSVGVEEGSDIREIRGPLAIPVGVLTLLAWLVALVLVGAAVYAVVRRRRGGASDGKVRVGPPPRPPHEVALEALDELEASGLLARGEVKEFHIRVSEILRRYIEDRFRVPALEMTTWEVLGGLQSIGIHQEIRTDLRRFLDQCDLVKFAKATPRDADSRAVLELGRDLVRRSIPSTTRPGGSAVPSEAD